HPLVALCQEFPSAANRGSWAKLENGRHHMQRACVWREHDSSPHQYASDSQLGEPGRGFFAFATDHGQKIGAGGACFVDHLVATSAVKTDRRPLNIDTGAIARLLDRRRKLLRAMDAAVTQLALDLGVPAVGENIVTGEVDDGIATVDFVLPGSGRGR